LWRQAVTVVLWPPFHGDMTGQSRIFRTGV